ncbi:MAG: hypothetical protein ACREMX_03555 [Gemmatimonadales bacterium]
MERITGALYGFAAVLLLVGLTLRVIPAPSGVAEVEPSRSAAPAAAPRKTAAGAPESTATAIVGGNVFSATRAAPRVRFTPPDLAPPPEPAAARRGTQATRLRLFGTVVGPSGTAALIDADPAVRGAEIYQVGDVIDGRSIVAVSESSVVLEGGAGRIVLRLQAARQPTP